MGPRSHSTLYTLQAKERSRQEYATHGKRTKKGRPSPHARAPTAKRVGTPSTHATMVLGPPMCTRTRREVHGSRGQSGRQSGPPTR